MPALDSMIIVALTFLLAGSVKGVTGLGLPSVSLAFSRPRSGSRPPWRY